MYIYWLTLCIVTEDWLTLCIVTVQYCTVQYCTVQYCTVQYCTVQYCTVQYCTEVGAPTYLVKKVQKLQLDAARITLRKQSDRLSIIFMD